MALKATVFKANLQIADMDRHYYHDHGLTLAQHPSETDERMMVRLLAYALNADKGLEFSKGLCVDVEPELWLKELSGDIRLWVEFGEADEKWLRKAASRAEQVKLYAYGGRSVPVWWQKNQSAIGRYQNLEVWNIPAEQVQALGQLVSRSMQLNYSVSDGEIYVSNGADTVLVTPERLQ
ncbi:MAG: YaeQ family protein [Shewanella sp.]|nr:YaeQ family protein [Shewanella sp.]MCF1439719.1 YaeQ family protein [Shewanella sp.]MCF1456593.1 YaeQ family protein [Shewanella sp.]